MDGADPLSLNLYTYCANNTVMYTDPSGNDSIWLQYNDGAGGFGHTSLLLQDADGNWTLVYWGGGGGSTIENINPLGVTPYMECFKLGKGELNSLQDIVDFLDSHNDESDTKLTWSEGLSDYLYFNGDFDASVNEANDIYNKVKNGSSEKYNLYKNNCLQFSMHLLQKGTFEQYDKDYKKALVYSFAIAVPNDAFIAMKSFSSSIGAYREAKWWKRIFMVSPYNSFELSLNRRIL